MGRFMVGDRRQTGTPGKQASKAGQKLTGSVMDRQAGNNGWKDLHVAEHNLAVILLEQEV